MKNYIFSKNGALAVFLLILVILTLVWTIEAARVAFDYEFWTNLFVFVGMVTWFIINVSVDYNRAQKKKNDIHHS